MRKLLGQPALPLVICLVILGVGFYATPTHKYFEQTTAKIYSQQEITVGQVVWTKTMPWFGPVYTSEISLDFGDKKYTSPKIEAIFDVKNGEQEWAEMNFNGNGDVIGKTVLHLLESKKPVP